MNNKISVVITSYKRFNLLKNTVDSFLTQNTYPIEKFIIIDDSNDPSIEKGIRDHYEDKAELIFNNDRLGQIKSIDKAYQLIDTPYIFHSEDDYIYEGNKNFISNSIDILEENINFSQVHIKGIGVPEGINNNWVDHREIFKTKSGIEFKKFAVPFCGSWYGFSFNPAIKRLSDYKNIFPNGYQKHIQNPGETGDISEYYCNMEMYKAGFNNAGILLNTACRSVGQWFSTYRKKGSGGIL